MMRSCFIDQSSNWNSNKISNSSSNKIFNSISILLGYYFFKKKNYPEAKIPKIPANLSTPQNSDKTTGFKEINPPPKNPKKKQKTTRVVKEVQNGHHIVEVKAINIQKQYKFILPNLSAKKPRVSLPAPDDPFKIPTNSAPSKIDFLK